MERYDIIKILYIQICLILLFLPCFPLTGETKKKITNLINNNKAGLIETLAKKLEKPFSFYDINKEVAPYKDYIVEGELAKMANYYKIDKSDLKLLKEKLEDWRGERESGIDEKGLFVISTLNKSGILDSWGAYDVLLIEDLLKNTDFISHAIFTPDCKLIESEQWFYHVGKSNEKEFLNWEQEYRDILKKYLPNSFVLLVDCHI